ncbi:hypothetical protein BOTCAL_0187g00190 [Botryotinia calthae]|uniref:Stc1 domain-containing protein n=1 Tax=Botryotinia calthae TaxID=38488 RepID=A0A4Y8D2R6_9HELO|nr:hypothetical protein BOTCAL_0187g00190 [Botryotinia calthae]
MIEVCRNDHEGSKRRKCAHCFSWEEGLDLARCTYEAALEAGEVERKVVRSRLCEQCAREMIEDMKAKLEQRRKEEAVESKEEAISTSDKDEVPQRHAESSNQLYVEALTVIELGGVEKAVKELVEVESTSTKSRILLGDVGLSKLRNLERNAGPGHEIQGINQANTKHLASTTKKEPVGGTSSDAPDSYAARSDDKVLVILTASPVERMSFKINAQEDAADATALNNEEDEEDEVEEEEPMIVVKKEEAYEQRNEKKEETDELEQCTVTQSMRSQAPAAARRGRSTVRGLKSSLTAKNTPAKRGRGQNEKLEENTPTAKKQRTNKGRKSMG